MFMHTQMQSSPQTPSSRKNPRLAHDKRDQRITDSFDGMRGSGTLGISSSNVNQNPIPSSAVVGDVRTYIDVGTVSKNKCSWCPTLSLFQAPFPSPAPLSPSNTLYAPVDEFSGPNVSHTFCFSPSSSPSPSHCCCPTWKGLPGAA